MDLSGGKATFEGRLPGGGGSWALCWPRAPPLCSCPPQATHHHSQHPPAAMAAAGQRQQLRVPAAPTDEVSRWGSGRKLQSRDAKTVQGTAAICDTVPGGGAADGHVRYSRGEERTGSQVSVVD